MALYERGWRLRHGTTVYDWGGRNPADPWRRNLGRVYNREAPDASEVAITSEDTQRPRTDTMRFGQDYRGGRTWTFTLGVKAASEAAARVLLGEAERAWRGDGVRQQAGAVASLTTLVGGQERTVYGRPRKFTPNYSLLSSGEASAIATFETQDDVWYGPEQSVRIDLAPSASGYATFPVTFPLTFAAPSTAANQITVGGTLPSWVVADIYGPISNPQVRLTNGWTLALSGSILTGRSVRMDARPGVRSVVDQSGGSLAGSLVRASRLSDASLPVGGQQLSLVGVDPTGAAYMIVRWQDAFAGMM